MPSHRSPSRTGTVGHNAVKRATAMVRSRDSGRRAGWPGRGPVAVLRRSAPSPGSARHCLVPATHICGVGALFWHRSPAWQDACLVRLWARSQSSFSAPGSGLVKFHIGLGGLFSRNIAGDVRLPASIVACWPVTIACCCTFSIVATICLS